MTTHEWKVLDMVKRGVITYVIGDKVVVYRRKSNGYPKAIKDGIEYTIRSITGESLQVAINSSDGIGWLQPISVNKNYMIPKYVLRDINLKKLLGE